MKKKLTAKEITDLFSALKTRFEANPQRHEKLKWERVQAKLEANPGKLWSLLEMEKTGGEPDVISYNKRTGDMIFCDCSSESPKGRRSLCYDHDALKSRKENKPKGSAVEMAEAMGIEMLNEDEYQALQHLGPFDTKTSSWLVTPPTIRELGGAIFGDRRFDHVFIYHNGAESYYAARGFRGSLRI